MDDKKAIVKMLLPVAALETMTPDAAQAVPQCLLVGGYVPVRKYPFKIGRESRVRTVRGKIERIERPKMDDREPNNDLYLVDRGQLLNISREHLQIEYEDDHFVLRDRGSACGTRVNGEQVGGKDSGGVHVLADGDEIIIGIADSPYRFRFIDLSSFSLQE